MIVIMTTFCSGVVQYRAESSSTIHVCTSNLTLCSGARRKGTETSVGGMFMLNPFIARWQYGFVNSCCYAKALRAVCASFSASEDPGLHGTRALLACYRDYKLLLLFLSTMSMVVLNLATGLESKHILCRRESNALPQAEQWKPRATLEL